MLRFKKGKNGLSKLSIGKKIEEARKNANLSRPQLAEKCGWPRESGRVRLTNYETEKREPKEKDVALIAKALGVPKAWFYGGGNEISAHSIPLIDWQDLIDYKSVENISSKPIDIYRPDIFALKVKNNSMDSVNGVSFPPGCIILVEPFAKYKSEDYVIAQLDHDSFVFRQIILEGTERYLRALNPGWKPINLTDRTNIVGVVVSSIMKFK